ncbi:MAG TPA: response regulator transcription factor [Acidobacteriota bacterium]|jgi:DNA-binding NarL/FixJ family response regulator
MSKAKVCILTRDKFRYIGIFSTLIKDGDLIVSDTRDLHDPMDPIIKFQPDVAVVDITTIVLDLPTYARDCKRISPQTRILAIGIIDDDDIVVALHAGVRGYLNILYFADEIIDAIKAVHQGSAWITGKLMGRFIDEIASKLEQQDKKKRKKTTGELTETQQRVLQLLASEGLTNKEIAAHLAIEERTVEFHITNLLRRFGVPNRNRLIIYAIKHGLVPLKELPV